MAGSVRKRRMKDKERGTGYLREKNRRKKVIKKFGPGGLLPALPEISQNWDRTKSFNANMKRSGLTKDPNRLLKKPGNVVHDNIVNSLAKIGNLPKPPTEKKQKKKKCDIDPIKKAIDVIEAKVKDNIPLSNAMDFGQDWRLLCTYLMDRYKNDYKAMARDPRNYYQETPKQLRYKIGYFVNHKVYFTEYCEERKIPVDKTQFIPVDKCREYDNNKARPYGC